MSPLQIEILLHYNARSSDFRDGDFSAPAVAASVEWMTSERLLEPSTNDTPGSARYRITARGRALVETLCMTPLPVLRECWVTPARVERIHQSS